MGGRLGLGLEQPDSTDSFDMVKFFLVLAPLGGHLFLTTSVVYISVIDTHITNHNLSHVGPLWAASMYCL